MLVGMNTRGDRLRFARERAGYTSGRAAAAALDIPASTYNSHERAGQPGARDFGTEEAQFYAGRYNVDAIWLLTGSGEPPAGTPPVAGHRAGFAPAPEFMGERDLPVFASAEGGNGALVISTEPIDFVPRPWYLKQVRDGYAVIVNGTSMEPVYEPGDMAVVNPRAALVKGKDVILVGGEDNGEFRASIKRYMGQNNAEWLLRQFNPPEGEGHDIRRFKHEWPRALRVVGKYDGG